MNLKIILEPSDEGGYTVLVPSLPGCISEGNTEEEALRNIKEAIELYLEPVEDDYIADEKTIIKELFVWVKFQVLIIHNWLMLYKETAG